MEYEIDTGTRTTQPIKQRYHLWSPYVRKEVRGYRIFFVLMNLAHRTMVHEIMAWIPISQALNNKVTKKDAYPLPKFNPRYSGLGINNFKLDFDYTISLSFSIDRFWIIFWISLPIIRQKTRLLAIMSLIAIDSNSKFDSNRRVIFPEIVL